MIIHFINASVDSTSAETNIFILYNIEKNAVTHTKISECVRFFTTYKILIIN